MEMQGGQPSSQVTRRLPPPTSGYGESPERGRPGHFSPPPPDLPKHLSRGPSREHIPEQMKNKIEVMELSDLHNPTCKLHASQSFEDHSPVRERRGSDVSDIFLSPEAYKATQAVEFIAEHLRNEDEYVQIREDWKYVAMVVDRAQLWLFLPRHHHRHCRHPHGRSPHLRVCRPGPHHRHLPGKVKKRQPMPKFSTSEFRKVFNGDDGFSRLTI